MRNTILLLISVPALVGCESEHAATGRWSTSSYDLAIYQEGRARFGERACTWSDTGKGGIIVFCGAYAIELTITNKEGTTASLKGLESGSASKY